MRLIDADALMKKLGITNMDCNECQWGTRYGNICCCCSRGGDFEDACIAIENAPTIAQPERLTDDDFETIRIHLSAIKGHLCNQHRWKEAEEYQRIIDRFMSFATAQPPTGHWIIDGHHIQCSKCGETMCNTDREGDPIPRNFCPNCGARMVTE